MLILTRKPGESLYIGDQIKITIVELKGHQIRVGIEAPKEMRIYREEIYLQILEENKKAAQAPAALGIDLDNLSAAWTARSAPFSDQLASGPVVSGDSDEGGKSDDEKPRVGGLGGLSTVRVGAPRSVGSGEKGGEGPVVVRRKKPKGNDE